MPQSPWKEVFWTRMSPELCWWEIAVVKDVNWKKYRYKDFTGVQASGVIIFYCDNAVSYGPKL